MAVLLGTSPGTDNGADFEGANFVIGCQFTATATDVVDTITLVLDSANTLAGTINACVFTDNAGAMGTKVGNTVPITAVAGAGARTSAPGANAPVTVGVSYWLAFVAGAQFNFDLQVASPGPGNTRDFNNGSTTFPTTAPAQNPTFNEVMRAWASSAGGAAVVQQPDPLSPAALNGPDAPPGFFESSLLPIMSADVLTPVADADTGAGTEPTGDVSATVPGTDSGAGSETGSGRASRWSDSDSGTGTDAQTSIVSPVSGSDSAAGTDTGTVSATVPGSESSTGTDTGSVSATASSTESGAGSDAGAVSATAASSDSGSGSESGSAAASVPGSDSGTGTEGQVVTETGPGGEGGAGTETGTVSVTASGADSGAGTDAGSVVDVTGGPTTLTGADSGTGSESGTVVDLTVVEPPPSGGGGDYGDESAIYGEPMRVLSDSDAGRAVEVGVVRDLTPAPERRRLRVILPRRRPEPEPEVFRALSDGDGAAGVTRRRRRR
jgi:hypothetical protein